VCVYDKIRTLLKLEKLKETCGGGVLMQTALINRLERIFEACFPSISVPDAEEEVTSLKHLLETSTLPIKTREALAENG
jgi:hypothetical protein